MEREARQEAWYQKLIQTVEQMVRQIRQLALCQLPLVQRVITQTRTRVLEGRN